jgi:hypothetical protein
VPTVLRVGPYRFFFYAGDRGEPVHVHVERDQEMAKFWLQPVRLAKSRGFASAELNRISRLVEENQERLQEAWNDYFES